MDIYKKYASPAEDTREGAFATLMGAYGRIQADNPRKVLARVAEPSLQERLEQFSARSLIQRVSDESRVWAASLRSAIEGKRLTALGLHGSRCEVLQALECLAQIRTQIADEEADLEETAKVRELEAALTSAQKTIEQISCAIGLVVTAHAQLVEADAQKATRIAELEAKLAEQAKEIEALTAPKQTANSGKLYKREAAIWKPACEFRRKCESFLRNVELGAGALRLAHGLDKNGPLFRAPDLWRALKAEGLIVPTQKDKTLDEYARAVLHDSGFTMPSGRPVEVAGLCGVEFLRECYRVGCEIAAGNKETSNRDHGLKRA